jgi:hypothetical protein
LKSLSSPISSHLRTVIAVALCYVCFAFAFSFIGFLHPESASFLPEWTYSSFGIEILGHFAFGFAAALPMLDLNIAILGGTCSVLIDSDHILDSLNIGVSGRPDHSISFILFSAIFLFVLGRSKLNVFSKSSKVKLVALAPVVVINHVSYDIFASGGSGSSFPLLIPFSYMQIPFSYGDWYTLFIAALIISGLGYLVSKRLSYNESSRQREKDPNREKSQRPEIESAIS